MPAQPWQSWIRHQAALRQRIATQHSVGHEETRMRCVHVGARLESHTARVSVATVAVVAVASGRDAVRRRRTNAGTRQKTKGASVLRH